MINVILSHWAAYLFLFWLVVIAVANVWLWARTKADRCNRLKMGMFSADNDHATRSTNLRRNHDRLSAGGEM